MLQLLELFAVAVLTFALELPVVWLFYRRRGCRHLVLYILLVNLLTNLLLNGVLIFTSIWYFIPVLITGEVLVVIAEFLLYYAMYPEQKAFRAALASVSANAFSLLTGLVLFAFIPSLLGIFYEY